MTDLRTRASALQIRLLDRQRAATGVQAAQRLTEVASAVQAIATRLDAARSLVGALGADGLAIAGLDKRTTEDAVRARTNFRSTATRLEGAEITDAEIVRILDAEAFSKALGSSDAVVSRLASSVNRSLEDERIALLPADIDAPVPDVGQAGATARRMAFAKQRLQAPIRVLAASLSPAAVDEILQSREKRANAARQWSEGRAVLDSALAAEAPQMRAFLTAAASEEGAPLELLTAEVLGRIASQGRSGEFVVRNR